MQCFWAVDLRTKAADYCIFMHCDMTMAVMLVTPLRRTPVSSLIQMQHGYVGSKTLLQQNPLVFSWVG